MTYDPFKLESGLLGDCDIVVTDSIFTNRLDAFDPNKLELHLTVQEVDGEDGEQTIYLGCGDGWETVDEGATAQRTDGKERNFHQSTRLGEFFGGLVKVMSADEDANKAIRARAEAHPLVSRDADFWKGLGLHVARETRKGGNRNGETFPDFDVLVIDGFNGVEGAAAPAKKAAKKAAKATKKAAPKAAAGGLTDAIRSQLDVIADASADHDSFMEAAFAQVPEASTDDEVKAAVADNESEDGIWQQAIARYNATQEG